MTWEKQSRSLFYDELVSLPGGSRGHGCASLLKHVEHVRQQAGRALHPGGPAGEHGLDFRAWRGG